MSKYIQNLIGQKFGRLMVIDLSYNNKGRKSYTCLCDCGNEVTVREDQLKCGVTKSCGCLQKEIAKHTMSKNMNTHGLSSHPLNRILNSMKQRCYNEKDKGFKYYGGRGVSICDEWLADFQTFYDWAIKNGYKRKLSIDRIKSIGIILRKIAVLCR